MLDAKSNETPRQPRPERAPRADRRDDAAAKDRNEPRADACPTRDAEPREASATSTKSADTPTTRQAKDGQSSDRAEPAVETPAGDAPAALALTTADFAAVAAIAEITPKNAGGETIPAATDEAAPVSAAADRKPEAGDDTSAVPTDVAIAPLAETPIIVAVAVPAPINPAPVNALTSEAAPIAPVQAAPAPADVALGETQPAAIPPVAGEAARKPVAAAPKTDSNINAASEDEPKTAGAPKPLAEAAETTSPLERKAESADKPGSHQLASDQPARIAHAAPQLRPAATVSSGPPAAELSAEPQAKAATPQPHGQSAEQAAAPRAIPAEARIEAAPQAALPLTGAVNNAPVMPFHLALSSSLALPALPHAALRIDAAADNAIAIPGLAVAIVARAQDGLKRFDIRLDPPELGRIDVRLDVDQGGKVTSRLVVERAETLDLLRRDAPQLERALQHAGLNTEGGLQFSLRDQSFANRDQLARETTNTSHLIVPEDDTAATDAARRGYGRLVGLGGGVDIRV
jgi:flagellar hook-length control protein FliK